MHVQNMFICIDRRAIYCTFDDDVNINTCALTSASNFPESWRIMSSETYRDVTVHPAKGLKICIITTKTFVSINKCKNY